jgi:hypothetical protein
MASQVVNMKKQEAQRRVLKFWRATPSRDLKWFDFRLPNNFGPSAGNNCLPPFVQHET